MKSVRSFVVAIGVAVCLFGCALVSTAAAQQASGSGSGSGGPKDGDACKVTAGVNKGKVGKYSSNATYCEGDWGATECAQPDGTSKCSSAITRPPWTKNELAILRAYATAVASGTGPAAVHSWETKYNVKVLRGAGGHVTLKLHNKTVTFDTSKEGFARLFAPPSK